MTGTFDNWAKSTRLDKQGSAFEKTVSLSPSDDKILYKVRTPVALLFPFTLSGNKPGTPTRDRSVGAIAPNHP